ncbi:MAG: benzoyl-CoA reductase subunit A [Chloracidobacterium sp.]|nr:benzoyl-CoA reductase subunit A [Chloracidobacterium sp.]
MDCCYIGIDLGSTTTKAVFLDENENILGRGITNSRSNYELACQVAREEAEINARFELLKRKLGGDPRVASQLDSVMDNLACQYALAQHLKQLEALRNEVTSIVKNWIHHKEDTDEYLEAQETIFDFLVLQAYQDFLPGAEVQSDFFRDLATSLYLKQADLVTKERQLSFERLVGVFDAAIIRVENKSFALFYREYLDFARDRVVEMEMFKDLKGNICDAVLDITKKEFNILNTVGTGYGRLTLPFAKEQIRSEILCHGLGAHFMFPDTKTVLDIGGQDTKAIQVDGSGIVTSFQMNDRCAAGCGRYLGYIADEMNMGVHQLGPLAMTSKKAVKINSTCTVFAGAELRERLAYGEKQEDILAGLHRAIILRAMSLLARSGGVSSEFTFTGGVARNEAAIAALKKLIDENYGEIKINISSDSIFTGAVGAALFAKRDPKGVMADLEISKLKATNRAARPVAEQIA